MVFLPCPRFRRVSDHSPGAEGNSLSSQPATVPETNPPGPEVEPAEESREIADIFSSLASRPGSRTCVPFRSRCSPSQAVSARYHAVTQRKSRLSLISLPSKLRRKFSRDVRLSRRTSASTTVSGMQVSSQDIFSGDREDDDDYDSDARYILTPQITQQLDGSPRSVHRSRRKASANPPQPTEQDTWNVCAEAQRLEVDEFGRFLGDDRIRGAIPENSEPPVETAKHTITDQIDNPSCAVLPAREDPIPRTLCNTPADSCLEDQAFYTPMEGHSPSRHSGLGKGDTAANSIQSSSRKSFSNRTLKADEHFRSQTPTPSRHSGLEDGENAGSLARSNLTHQSYATLPDDPSRSEQLIPDAHPSDPGLASCTSVPPGHAPTAHDYCETNSPAPQSRDSMMPRDSKFYKNASKTSLLSGPKIPSPRGWKSSSPGKLQVSKRNSTAATGSRFVENFDDDSTVGLQTQTNLQGKGTSGHRVSSEGWLSGGKRLGYGYNFIADLTPEKPSAVGDLPEGDTNNESQNASSLTTATDEPKQKATGGSKDPVTEEAENPETKTTQLRRSLSVTSWLKYPKSTTKRELSERQAPKGIIAENSWTAARDLNFDPDREILHHPESKLFKPWRRLCSGNSLPEKHYEKHIARSTQENPASLDTVNENQNICNSVLEELPDNKKNIRLPTGQGALHNGPTSDFDAIERGPGGYDGSFDVRFGPMVSHDDSIYDAEQDEPGSLADISAEAWSRMYQECLPHLTLSEEADAGLTGQSGGFRVRRKRRHRNVCAQDISITASMSGELRASSPQVSDSQGTVQGQL